QELNLSAAAVSRQIKSLEERLKVPLFQRSHRKVHLTKAGEELLHTTQLMMRLMRDTTRKFEPRAKGRQIRIATDLAFAHFWLLPRLVSIQEAIGATIISVIASDDVDACLSDSVDIPIVYGGADWTGFNAEYLLEES